MLILLVFFNEVCCQKYIKKKTLENTEWEITNGKSRDAGNIGHTRHRTKTNKIKPKSQHNTTQKTKNKSATRTPTKPES
jgi:hypothetical protein